MFEYYYHEILRRTIISFGTLFNGIEIKHDDSDGDVSSVIKVPLAYGPTQKFLARLQQSPDLNKPTQISLPRMSFEFVGLQYDGSRKVTTTQTFKSETVGIATAIRKTYMPVPYNMSFELSVFTKLNDDMLQIVEQILPYFQPSYNLSVDLVSTIGEKRDIPVIVENITMEDDYEGDFTTRRSLIYTFRFTAKHTSLVLLDPKQVEQRILSRRQLLDMLLVDIRRLQAGMLLTLLNLVLLRLMIVM